MKDRKKLSLEEELQLAVEDVVIGQTMRGSLVGTIKRTIQGILIRRRIRGANVEVRRQGMGFEILILIRQPGARVREIRLNMG